MKRLFAIATVFILALSVLTACGGSGNNGDALLGNPESTSAQESSNALPSNSESDAIIRPSELITLEDAERILGMSMHVIEGYLDNADPDGFYLTEYITSGEQWETLSITIKQDASSLIETIKLSYENNTDAIPIEEIEDWAFVTGNSDGMSKHLYIAYGDCYIDIELVGDTNNDGRSLAEDAAWKIEKLTEAGKLAVERLGAMIKNSTSASS